MEPDYAIFQTFNDPALADGLIVILDQHQIVYQIEEGATSANPLMALNNEMDRNYVVKIHPEDFGRANQALTEEYQSELEFVEPDHYLFKFTNEELLDLLAKPDEWNAFDYQLAQKILVGRGVNISAEKIAELNQDRMEELQQPEQPQTIWIILGYIMAVLGGLLGLLIGWHLSSYQKTLPNGQKVFGYSENDRAHGKRIFYIGIVGLLLAIYFRISRASID